MHETLQIDHEALLQEAETWPENKNVNWSQLARNYGLHSPNGGEIIKEFLEQIGIPAAPINQKPTRAKRRCIKKVRGDGLLFPMFSLVQHGKQKLLELIQKEEVNIGEEAVPSSKYSLWTQTTRSKRKQCMTVQDKVLSLTSERSYFKSTEHLGIVRDSSDTYFNNLSTEDRDNLMVKLGVHTTSSTEDRKEWLKQICRTRHIKMWHDHSTIAAHGYLQVLVSVIYDPAFFYTTEEMTSLKGVRIDVPAILDEAEVHILGRSSSSLKDQLTLILLKLDVSL